MRSRKPLYNVYQGIYNLATPASLSFWWNLGSCLGLILSIQLISGLFISMHYSCDTSLAFESISHILRDVNHGWLLRSLHCNGATFFFIALYLHIGRGLYYGSFFNRVLWFSGFLLLVLVMATAFVGYVLPWGQMSFWGATVITNLLSTVPFIGTDLVTWLWGGFSVDNPTLTRFYTFHFLLPFIIIALSFLHLFILHLSGSSNPLGLKCSSDNVPFHIYFTTKDVLGFIILFTGLLLLSILSPSLFLEADNFIPANPLITPSHIVPEWYFLFAYAILRCVPSKSGGAALLLASLLVLVLAPFSFSSAFKSFSYYGPINSFFWSFIVCFFILTLAGAWPVALPFLSVTQSLSFHYFFFFVTAGALRRCWDNILL